MLQLLRERRATVRAALLSLAAAVPPPLVDLPLAGDLRNRGRLGGEAGFVDHVAGQEALYGPCPWGECLDLTNSARHGGGPDDTSLAGGPVRLPGGKLTGLGTFTIVLWARRQPGADGVNARYAHTDRGWDLLPSTHGLSLGLGAEAAKRSHNLNPGPRQRPLVPAESDWRFVAVAVDETAVRGWLAGLTGPLLALSEVPRTGPRVPDWGDLELGTFAGIRPYKGWLARFRVYDQALSAEQLETVLAADRAAGFATARPLAGCLLPEPERRFVLPRSAVPFSTRWQKQERAFDVLRSFGATHCLWVYGADPAIVRRYRESGVIYQGTVNGLEGYLKATRDRAAAGDPSGRHEDLDGNKNMPSWMVTFGPTVFTGCVNHPAFRELFFGAVQKLVEAGVDWLQVDDSAMNASWSRTAGVCFCPACRQGFREWLAPQGAEALRAKGIADISTFDYREHLKRNGVPDAATYRRELRKLPLTPDFLAFQAESTRGFYRDLRRQLDGWAPDRYVAVSVNENFTRPGSEGSRVLADVVDFYLGEIYDRRLGANLAVSKAAEAYGLRVVASPLPRHLADGLRGIALAYALGQRHLVPWDVYMGSDAEGIAPRYFGTREEYGAIFDFVNQHRALLDGYRTLAEVGVVYDAGLEPSEPLLAHLESLAAGQVPYRLFAAEHGAIEHPLRAEELSRMAVLVTYTSPDQLHPSDAAALAATAAGRRTRMVAPDRLAEALRGALGDVLRVEAPEGVYAFPRARDDGALVIHLVNWNAVPDGSGPEVYAGVTLALRHPERWAPIATARWHQPGEPTVTITPERHQTHLRFVLPRLGTWGVLEVVREGGAG